MASVSGQSTSGASQRSTASRMAGASISSYALEALLSISAAPPRLPTQKRYALEALLSISAAPPRLPTQKRKPGLSLPAITMNLRAFTQKSGPVFWFQDNVEATLAWDDPAWTVFVMGVYALVVMYPLRLIPAGAPAILVYILILTHNKRFPGFPRAQALAASSDGASKPAASTKKATGPAPALSAVISPADAFVIATEEPARHPPSEYKAQAPIVPELPHEGSLQYYENVRDIQNLMAMVALGYDEISPIMPYINWSSYSFTLVLMQLAIVATVAMFFLGPYLPLQPVLLVGGEALFILTHPYFHPVATTIARKAAESEEGRLLARKNRAILSKVQELIDLDRLSDETWERGWKVVEMYENQRWMPLSSTASHRVTSASDSHSAPEGTWSGHHLRQGDRRPWTKGQDGWTAAEGRAGASSGGAGWSVDVSKVEMSPGQGWSWVDGDDWRIDWVGAWSELGADEEGFVYTDSSWQRPAPVPYGHPHAIPEPTYDSFDDDERSTEAGDDAASEKTVGGGGGQHAPRNTRFSKRRALYDALAGVGLVSSSASAAETAAGVALGPARAETRRRRWLRRAVRVA
ncbi:unnamed protein product [Tilletia controversa]|nr:unnamed protein product [Tilletia controversa]